MEDPAEDASPRMTPAQQISLQTVPVVAIAANTKQGIIVITEDKLELVLRDAKDSMDNNSSWIVPLGWLVTLLVALLTSTFKDFWLTAEQWQALFGVAALGVLAWTVAAILKSFRRMTVREIIVLCKQDKLHYAVAEPQNSQDYTLQVRSVSKEV